jgi:two-component system, NarL family, sensor kinase
MPLAATIVCLSCVVSGTVLLRARTARLAGAFLLMSGAVGLAAVWTANAVDAEKPAAVLMVLSAMIMAPLACWAYPEPWWRTSADVVLGVTLVGPGVVALADPLDESHVATMGLVAGTALLVQTWWRLEHSTGQARRGLIWFGLAAGGGGFVAVSLLFISEGTSAPVAHLGVALLAATPAAMAFGAMRPDVVDVRGLVVYAVMLAVAATAFIAYYVGAYSVLSEVAGEPPTAGVQAVVALMGAAALHPGSIVLRGVIDRLLFGDRPDALRAATRALDRFGADPDTALDAVCESLVLPYARLVLDAQVLGTSGAEATGVQSVPLSLSDGTSGELVVGLRPGDLRLSPRDEHVLQLVGPLLAQSVRARSLAADLRESRGRAIATIEEERRRLRRDLHDGLGPTLTGIALSADAARNSLRTEPETADALLAALRSDAAEAVEAIRRLVYGMRPPALDELGLERALRQQASTLRRRAGGVLAVDFEVLDEIPPLAAAVEVAAYRIAMEALSNVARHSTGTRAILRLRADTDRLIIEVTDNGSSTNDWRPGVGVASMRERAAEVGGELVCGATPCGGRVDAVLPLL